MNIGKILYTVIIEPLIAIYNLFFTVLYNLIENPVLAILAFSIVVNFLTLPLYRKADLMQREEMEKAKKMRPFLAHIRKTFSGDERFMMTQAYYKVEHYNPFSAIKEAGPLLLQIPFFIAAYRYVSNIPALENASFGPITNLLAPDGLLQIGGLTINVLPIIMTLINCVSGYIYSKGGLLRQKIQIYGVAAVFLVLLYNSASGLVIYWIMNQVFSLCKNLVYALKIKNNGLLPVAGAVLIIILVIIGMVLNTIDTPLDTLVAECLIFLALFIIVRTFIYQYHVKIPENIHRLSSFLTVESAQKLYPIVYLTGFCLALLMGVFIPSSVISSSVVEFTDQTTGTVMSGLIEYPALVYFGLFMIWLPVIIFANEKKKRILAAALWAFLGVALVNQFLFDPHIGSLYSDLTFDRSLQFSIPQQTLNAAVCVIAATVFVILFHKRPRWVLRMAVVTASALFILSGINIFQIHNEATKISANISEITETDGILKLSRNGKNVVVIMMDRAIGGLAPFIFDEKPELKESFSGFTYYPNTVSFGGWTIFGSPGLFGGYEYTPAEMNKRDQVLLKDKHNEALLLMPHIFSENGFHVTVCDPPCVNYSLTEDLSIYDKYPEVDAYNLSGKFTSEYFSSLRSGIEGRQRHNFTAYSLFRIVPLFLKSDVYDGGSYHKSDATNHYTQSFLDEYAVMDALPSITTVTDDPKNNLILFQNATPHEPVALNPPDYSADGRKTDNSYKSETRTASGFAMEISDQSDWEHYCVNVVSYQKLAQWLDYLKDQGVYDNTRIIITADHGYSLGQFSDLIHPDGLDVEGYWPILLVKDFGSKGPFTTDTAFMTNADTPSLAMNGIIDDPVNPFTGNPVNDEMKRKGQLFVTDSLHHWIQENQGTEFNTEDAHWWTVHDSIFDMSNWGIVSEEEVSE